MEVPRPDTGGTVLLVEDQDAVRNLLQMALAMKGFRVVAARAAEEAVRLCHAHPEPISILVTDINLPGMKGPELARVLLGSHPGLKVLFLSGSGTDACGAMAEHSHFLQKPFQMDVLVRKVRDILAAEPTPTLA